jgi:hypothetical protein
MTEGIFAETIKQIWPFILIAAATCVNWLTLLNLGLQLNETRVKRSALFGFTLALTAVDFFGKQAISVQFGFLFAIPLFLFFFKRLCRLSWPQLLVTAVLGFSLAIFSKITLAGSFRHFLGRAEDYIPYQSLIVTGRGLLESIFPGFILFVAKLLDISFTPFTKKRVQSGLLMIGLFTLMIFLASVLFIHTNSTLIQGTGNVGLLRLLGGQLFMATAMVILLLLIRSHLIKEKERELDEERLKESQRLLETLASEYREFRNKLQVMDMMVAAGKEGEIIGRYIQEVAREISGRNYPDNPDPIIKATLLSWRIRAQERGISVIEQDHTVPLKTKPQRIAGEILSEALGSMIDEASRLRYNMVVLSREEKGGNTGFRLRIATNEQKRTGRARTISLSEERFLPLEDLLAKIDGRLEMVEDGIIIWCLEHS